MSDQRIRVEYRDVTSDGPVLHLSIPSAGLLTDLVRMFRKLSKGPTSLKASDLPFFDLDNVRDIEFVCIGEQKEPRRRLHRTKAVNFSDGFMTARAGFGARS